MTNVELLKERVKESGLKSAYIAERLGISRSAWYNKLKGDSKFTTDEVKALCYLLRINSLREREDIFFS